MRNHTHLTTPTLRGLHTVAYPWLSILEHQLSLRPTDQVVGKSCALHHIIGLVVLPGDGQLDEGLEVLVALADGAGGAAPSVAGGTPERHCQQHSETCPCDHLAVDHLFEDHLVMSRWWLYHAF